MALYVAVIGISIPSMKVASLLLSKENKQIKTDQYSISYEQ